MTSTNHRQPLAQPAPSPFRGEGWGGGAARPPSGGLWRHRAALILAVLALMLARPGWADALCPAGEAPFPAFYSRPDRFDAALAATAAMQPWSQRVTGVTVPHHLLVPDLIAGGLRLASGHQPRRIVVLTPDHFGRSPRPFATSDRGYQTVEGPVAVDKDAVAALLQNPLVVQSCLFGPEHGLRAELPFIARIFPGVPVVPVAISASATRADWDALAETLAPLVAEDTLLVQSTDFSHYLPQFVARQRDQQVLNLLAAGDLDGIARLDQPDHVDSVGALYIQTLLQARLHHAAPLPVANRNMQELSDTFIERTTSYMVILYAPEDAPADPPPFPGSHVYMLGGDLFLGRAMPRLLSDELVADRVTQAARAATGGLPLVLNLEGVLVPNLPGDLAPLTLAMPAAALADWVGRLNVVGLGLANNHATDLGPSGLAETEAALDALHLPHAAQGQRLDLPGVTLVMLSDLDGSASPPVGRLTPELLDRLLVADAARPVVAFVHWGHEWVTDPGPREQALAEAMRARGVAAIVGAHPHAASGAPHAIGGGDTLVVQTLGNFLFDQTGPRANGALAELRTFAQGTVFLRRLPLPQLFDLGRAVAAGQNPLMTQGQAD